MKTKPKTYKKPLQVILGSQTIKAFVASPKEFNVIGIVQMGMEFGLLATTSSGNYVRVNGSQIELLDERKVEAAIAYARSKGRGESFRSSAAVVSPRVVVAPTVIIRKRRRLAVEFQNDETPKSLQREPVALAA